jgi:hypothetical protein
MKIRTFLLMLCLIGFKAFSQSPPPADHQELFDFGFTVNQVSAFTTNVNGAFDLIFETTEIYYVNSSNQICYYKNVSGTWTNIGVLNSAAPAIRAGAQLHKDGNKIYYVASTDNKIYRLENITGTTWTYVPLVPLQVALRTDSDLYYSFPHCYYISTTGYVCDIVTTDGGLTFHGGNPLVPSSVQVRANSKLIQPLNTAFIYYITVGNMIGELEFSPTYGWGGTTLFSGTNVKVGTNLETDGDYYYYISGITNKVATLYWNGSGWSVFNLPCPENARPDIELKYIDHRVFFVGVATGKINILTSTSPTSWTAFAPTASMMQVKSGSKILAYSNSLFEEGSATNTFVSPNCFYVDNTNKLRYLTYDDAPCADVNQYIWNSDDCKVGGVFLKSWYAGPDVNIEPVNTLNGGIRLGRINKDIYFVNSSNQIKKIGRNPPTNALNYLQDYTISFDDEFNDLSTTQSKWNTNHNYCNTHVPSDQAYWDGYNNLSYNSGILSDKLEPVNISLPYWYQEWVPSDPGDPPATYYEVEHCDDKVYQYKTSNLQTGGRNFDWDYYYTWFVEALPTGPSPDYEERISCGPEAKLPTFTQKYGFFETRTKMPRGKGIWNAFWMIPEDYTWRNEIDIFELPGNGKYTLLSNWIGPGQAPRESDTKFVHCVGYRGYEDYHTYGLKWTSTDMTFYYDNKKVGYTWGSPSAPYNWLPTQDKMFLMFDQGIPAGFTDVYGTHNQVESEVPVTGPVYQYTDYVRVYTPYTQPREVTPREISASFNLYPNPAENVVTVQLPENGDWNLDIQTIEGKVVLTNEHVKGNTTINTEELSNGIYLFKIYNGINSFVRKVAISK